MRILALLFLLGLAACQTQARMACDAQPVVAIGNSLVGTVVAGPAGSAGAALVNGVERQACLNFNSK